MSIKCKNYVHSLNDNRIQIVVFNQNPNQFKISFALKFTQEMYTNSFAYEVMRITLNPEDSDKFATNGM
jgi:hypothetical protein